MAIAKVAICRQNKNLMKNQITGIVFVEYVQKEAKTWQGIGKISNRQRLIYRDGSQQPVTAGFLREGN